VLRVPLVLGSVGGAWRCLWWCLAVPGSAWRCVVVPGGAWRCLAVPGGAWRCCRCLAVPDESEQGLDPHHT
jgi:hypothetical protein